MTKRTGGIDFEEARARLARLAEATEAGEALSPEETRARLDARARALARPQEAPVAPATLREVVRFRAGGQVYALESRFVLEVVRAPELVPLPGAPPVLRGLTLLRGEVLPVVELAPLFGRPASGAEGPALVVGTARPELALRTEEVEEVSLLAGTALLPPPAALSDEAGALVSGVVQDGTLVLEGEALLGDSRLVFELSDEGAA